VVEIKDLKARIRKLIKFYTEQKDEATQTNQELYRKLDSVGELELIEKLPIHFLEAYLLFRQAHYSK
jgi:hypothetical protein